MTEERNAMKEYQLAKIKKAELEAAKGGKALKGTVLALITISLVTVAIIASNRQAFKHGYEEGYITGTANGMESLTNAQINRMSYVDGYTNGVQQIINVEVARTAEEMTKQ